MNRPRLLAILLAVTVIAVAVGCGAATRTDDRLVLVAMGDPSTLDPALAKDVPSGRVVSYVFSTLVRFDRQLKIEGDLCDSFKVDPDQRTYTFHLKPNARFASGKPVTAQDVKASFERVLDPKTASGRTWVFERLEGAGEFMAGKAGYVSGIQASGAIVTLKLTQPFAPFLGFLTMPAASVVDLEAVRAWGRDFPLHGAGSGPFTVTSWVRDSGVELAPNPHHHGGVPGLKGVLVRVIKEPVTVATEFKLGNLDACEVPSAEFASLTSDPRWTGCVKDIPGLNVYYLGLNCEKGPFQDKRLRQAAAAAIDRLRIVETVRKGQAVVATGPIPPGLLGHETGFRGIPFDAAKARAAGVPPGTTIRIIQGDDKANLEVTQMIQGYLQQAGFTVKVQAFETSTFKKKVDEGDFDAFYYSWFADYPDAENFLFPLFHSSRKGGAGNGPRYSDPEVDAMLVKAQATTDDGARRALYRSIEERVVADASRVFLFHKKMVMIHQPWVRGYEVYPVFNSDRMLGISLDLERLGKL